MAGYVRAQVTLRSGTTVPADNCTNTFHFFSASLSAEDTATSAATQLETFYTAWDQSVLSGTLLLPTADLKFYDLSDPEPRVPILEDTMTLTLASGAAYPSEVAICLSFQAERVSGENQARRRGRVYLGPLDADAGEAVGSRVVVTSAARTAIANAADAMATQNPLTDAIWATFSPTTAGSPPWSEGVLGDAMHAVTNGWIDNAFDTQRRRGTDPTSRTLWSA